MSHTPGPWMLCGDERGGCKCGQVWCSDFPVASVTIGKWGNEYPSIRLTGKSSLDVKAEPYIELDAMGEVSKEEAAANGRLISAAPDLLKACRNSLLQIEYLSGKFGETGTGNAVIAKLQAAIAKAEGK